MKFFIKEANGYKEAELRLVERDSGQDYLADLMGGSGALGETIIYNSDLDGYTIDAESFEWWSQVVRELDALDDWLVEMTEKHGRESVEEAIASAPDSDLEDHAAITRSHVAAWLGEEDD